MKPYQIIHDHTPRAAWEYVLLVFFAFTIAMLVIATWLWFRRRRYTFLPKASLADLERWGQEWRCPRKPGEDYDTYRARLTAHVRDWP